MTVFKRIAIIKIQDPKNPTKEIEIFQQQSPGVDVIPLQIAAGIGEGAFKFVCSDSNPTQPATMENIDRLLSRLQVVKELKSHPKDPDNFANHSIQITANLDDPNIDDSFLKEGHAKNVHDVEMGKETIRQINERYEKRHLKTLDERKTHFKIGEVERG